MITVIVAYCSKCHLGNKKGARSLFIIISFECYTSFKKCTSTNFHISPSMLRWLSKKALLLYESDFNSRWILSGTPSWRGINLIGVASLWSVQEGLSYLAREDELPGFMKMVGFVDKKNCRFEYYPSHPTNLPINKGVLSRSIQNE